MQDHKNGLQALEEPRLKKSCWGHTVQMRIDTTTHTHTHPHTLSLSSSPRHEGRNRAHGPGRPVNYFRGCESKVEAAGWKRNLGILDCNGQSASQLVEESLDDLCSACFGFHGHGLGGVSVSGGSHRHIQGNGHTPTPERAQSD